MSPTAKRFCYQWGALLCWGPPVLIFISLCVFSTHIQTHFNDLHGQVFFRCYSNLTLQVVVWWLCGNLTRKDRMKWHFGTRSQVGNLSRWEIPHGNGKGRGTKISWVAINVPSTVLGSLLKESHFIFEAILKGLGDIPISYMRKLTFSRLCSLLVTNWAGMRNQWLMTPNLPFSFPTWLCSL